MAKMKHSRIKRGEEKKVTVKELLSQNTEFSKKKEKSSN